jgi:hypothetical protein
MYSSNDYANVAMQPKTGMVNLQHTCSKYHAKTVSWYTAFIAIPIFSLINFEEYTGKLRQYSV